MRAEGIADPMGVSREAPGTPPHPGQSHGAGRTAEGTYPVPHDLTHAAIGLEVTLQGHGITSHHGRERLNVDSQVACGGKGRGW